ncbi:ketosteroid isomerase-like protein [Streptomyces sp. SAI-144]|uniref:nuclear transport factor 2 family protein n=1 Tax=Streptomyces sp. SAI-144 TaxID=2940544 RepID=UPI002476A2E3|nr:nuclear transport factor 2 family protein [Streptomyces sp. SAI-144]MDH6436680.1 ketosteroid isomerase-like protein [Streptomyces sp. SAI-144]
MSGDGMNGDGMNGDEERLARLEGQVRHLNDRQEILDRVARHARGHDRFDADLLTAAYHQDGVDEHGATVNSGPAYAQWANMTHAEAAELHTHNITTHLCEIDEGGDTAHCESYVLVGLLSHDGRTAMLMSGRYLDRLERRDGTWRIAVRRCTVDLALSADASVLRTPFFKEQGFVKGTRDRDDLSYRRPLTAADDPGQTPVTRW